jgi:hypothetical protein
MIMPHDIEKAVARVHDQASFLQDLLGRTLGWPVEHGIEQVEHIAYGWSEEDPPDVFSPDVFSRHGRHDCRVG